MQNYKGSFIGSNKRTQNLPNRLKKENYHSRAVPIVKGDVLGQSPGYLTRDPSFNFRVHMVAHNCDFSPRVIQHLPLAYTDIRETQIYV